MQRALWVGFFALALAFLGILVGQYYVKLAAVLAKASAVQLAASIALLMASNFGGAIIFSELTRRETGTTQTMLRVAGIFLTSQIGKYVPGRIWSIVLQRKFLVRAGSWLTLGIVNVEMAVLSVVCGSGVALACVAWCRFGATAFMLLIAATVLAIHLLAVSGVLRRCARWVWHRILVRRAQAVVESCAVGDLPRGHQRVFLGAVLYGALFAPGWLLFLSGFGMTEEQGVKLLALLAISSLVGMASLLPGGLGVREGVIMAFGSGANLDAELLATVALSTRAVILVLDALSFPLGIGLMNFGIRK